jgi:hypothetical protein
VLSPRKNRNFNFHLDFGEIDGAGGAHILEDPLILFIPNISKDGHEKGGHGFRLLAWVRTSLVTTDVVESHPT